MNIGEVLSRAWQITWKNKVLWIFGLLASLAGGSGGNNFRYNFEQRFGGQNLPAHIPAWALVLLILLALVLLVVFVILAAIGRAGLVRGAWQADGGETGFSFSRLFKEGQASFWRVLLLGILVVGISLALILLMIIPGVFLCLLPLFCVLVPVLIGLSVVAELAVVAIVGEGLSVVEGLHRGWEIFRDNLAQIIAIGVVMVLGTAVVGAAASLPMLAILAPSFLSASTGAISAGALLLSIMLFLLYLPILLAVQAITTTYVETAWTVVFRRLTGRVEEAI